jgi:peptide/nickel transport system permease protein
MAKRRQIMTLKSLMGNGRIKSVITVSLSVLFIVILFLLHFLLPDELLKTNLVHRNLPPALGHFLGTDWLGRDMFTRIVKGLFASFQIGLFAALGSTVIGLVSGLVAATSGRVVDTVITGLVDIFMSVPHLVLLILVSFVLGGGYWGIVIAVAVSHWPRLTRIVRAEIMQLRESEYVALSYRFGRTKWWIMKNHMIGYVAAQFFVGLILMFPHAILHAAGLSFLGFGMTPNNPSIGVLLSESMRYLSTGYWWLAVFPGLALLFLVKTFDSIGHALAKIFYHRTAQE